MVLMKAVPDETLAIPGYEQHTLQCSECGDVEQRLVFRRRDEPPKQGLDNGPQKEGHMPVDHNQVGPPLDEKHAAPPGIWTRAVETLRNRQKALGQEAAAANGERLFHWDHRLGSRMFKPAAPAATPTKKPQDQLRGEASQSAWARAIAKLGRLQDKGR
jgi:hypothetical protein